MWIVLNTGFLSIVKKDCSTDELLVRGRRENDILAVFPDANVRKTPGNDYLYRAAVKRVEIANALTKILMDYDVYNFKNSVKDDALHNACVSVWGAMGGLQPGGPYGGWATTADSGRQEGLFNRSIYPGTEDDDLEAEIDADNFTELSDPFYVADSLPSSGV